mgnify:CR=1 FL=1
MNNCIFCKIVGKEAYAKIIYEDDDVIAFEDINPQAKIHYLIIPKKHIVGIQEISKNDVSLVGKLFLVARKIAEKLNINNYENGYRLVFNVGRDTGQSVFHLHLHFLAGRKFKWPPG